MTDKDILEVWINEAQQERKKTALIEGLQSDESFWLNVFNYATNGKIQLDFPLALKSGQTGKGALKKYYSFLNEEGFNNGAFIICRDSDCEHLYRNENQDYLVHSYLFHTYIYNIENHKCIPQNLSKICREQTTCEYDFEGFVKKYSEITFPLWVIVLYLQEKAFAIFQDIKNANNEEIEHLIEHNYLSQIQGMIAKKEMQEVLKFDKKIEDIILFWAELEDKVQLFQEKIYKDCEQIPYFQDWGNELNQVKQNLQTFVNSEETLFYWNGHLIMEVVISPLFEKVRTHLVSRKMQEYPDTLQKEYRNKAFQNSITTLLDNSYKESFYGKSSCNYMQKIVNDIQNVFPY